MTSTWHKLRNPLLLCGIIASILYPLTDVIASYTWKAYDVNSQTVSELFAINAPSRSVVVPLFIAYSVFVYFFGWGIWLSAGDKRPLRIAAILIISKEVMGLLGTLFTPIHLRGIPGDMRDVWHGIITAAGVLFCMFPAMGFGAAAFEKPFRIYSIITMAVFITFGTLSGFMGDALSKNEPTPWMGIYERINIYGYMIWVIVFAILLVKRNNGAIFKSQ
ncbi:MAG TPA: DUF998 domain-containing protein [Bacteroidia bacterium]|nr:DUF998 domain-containing protein [Bacteroidia bacterium]